MNIQEHLAIFDGWLTGRIAEAHAARKDLAFRDVVEDDPAARPSWEYSLLEPGARSPVGDGWSVYRLSGVLPPAPLEGIGQPPGRGDRRSLLGAIGRAIGGGRRGRR